MRIKLDDLQLVEEYDGPKMLADLDNCFFYLWNQPSQKIAGDALFLRLDLFRHTDKFLGLFAYTETLTAAIKIAGKSWWRHSPGCGFLVAEDDEQPDIIWPVAPETLEPICDDLFPEYTQSINMGQLEFCQYAFGQENDAIWLKCAGKWWWENSYAERPWGDFLDNFLQVAPDVRNNPHCKIICHEEGDGSISFSVHEPAMWLDSKETVLELNGNLAILAGDGAEFYLPRAYVNRLFYALCENIATDMHRDCGAFMDQKINRAFTLRETAKFADMYKVGKRVAAREKMWKHEASGPRMC